MANIKLKSILGKRKKERKTIEQLVNALDGPIAIYDAKGTLLLGNEVANEQETAIIAAEQEVGLIKGPEKSIMIIKSTLELLLSKQAEQKEIGSEVLHLYRQINLIYGFSEELAKTIEPDRIGLTAIRQARQLIKADAAWVLMIDENQDQLIQLAAIGEQVDTNKLDEKDDRIIKHFLTEAKADIILDTATDRRTKGEDLQLKSLLHAPLQIGERITGIIILGSLSKHLYTSNDLKLLNTLALQTASAVESAALYEKNISEARQREEDLKRIHAATEKFVPYDLLRVLGRKSILDVMLGDQIEEKVTVMFSDIRGYTSLSENMTPEENFSFLNGYIGRVGPVINTNKGFIIRFLGDGIMALFLQSTDDAVKAGIDMQKVIYDYNKYRAAKNRKPIKVGIGMHQGPLIMGIMGNDRRLEANLVSDTVNAASRMEGLTKYYGSPLIITEPMFVQSNYDYAYRSLGKVQVKGKSETIEIYDVFEADPPGIFLKKEQTKAMFEEGLEHYYKRSFEAATASFAKVLSVHPEDKAAQLYLSKAVRYHTSGVHADWEGVEVMEVK